MSETLSERERSLETLILRNTPVGDRGLRYLSGLTSLKLLRVDWTGVTYTGIESLDAKLPDCIIPRFIE